MRIAINIDEDLLAKAARLSNSPDRASLVNEKLRAFVQRESAKRLAPVGRHATGSEGGADLLGFFEPVIPVRRLGLGFGDVAA